MTLRLLVAGLAFWLLASPCLAQELPGMGELESWLIIEEEDSPEPPLVQLNLGFNSWVESRTRVRVGAAGTRLEDLEENQGLPSGGIGPWAEFSIGSKLRFGVDASWTKRIGKFDRQNADIVFDGIRIAEPGDYAKATFEFVTVAFSVEWNALYGRTYRIGLLGGMRYFRMNMTLTGLRATLSPRKVVGKERGELLSPYFGGLVELTPFPYLNVYTRIQFVNWSWDEVNLKEASFVEFRLGVTVNLVPETMGLSLEYRFLVVDAVANDGRDRFEGTLSANGLVVYANFSF